ncbi:hypothetical protein [uncultured Azohydromonas sp.]|jgi:hypothetical protein|uniref:hypothetical protein n=1 Tax=uncultured Azohydromonas sp. TaxID=487342 RepID=UPI00261F9772|nr:hypothetical protein [uncultured Azohydromonas sp.]
MRTMLKAVGIGACAALLSGAALGQGAPHWAYRTTPDKMGRGEIKIATINSSNTVDFLPHKSERATLALRVHPRHGKTAMLQVGPGEFLCPSSGCRVAARFDAGKVVDLPAVRPADYTATNVIFVRDHDRLLVSLKTAKRLLIEADFYGYGSRVFEFDVAGLQW